VCAILLANQATVEGRPQPPPLGTLIFSCNGRGVNLYGEPNYDSTTLASFVPVPTSGMFCNGAFPPSENVGERQVFECVHAWVSLTMTAAVWSVLRAGEIGQVGKSTYLHGFTAAVGILREQLDANE
jgi:small ligand-binding sensory domain FIST